MSGRTDAVRTRRSRERTGKARRPLAGAAYAGISIAVVALAVASAAHAGTYVINNCPSAPIANGNAGPWTVFGGPQANKGTCSGGAGDSIGPRGASMTPGSIDGVQVTVPAGSAITIREAKVWWSVPHQIAGASTFALAGTNGGLVGESGTPLDKTITPDDFKLPSTTTSFVLEDYCSNDDAGNGCVFGAGENTNLQLFGSQLTLAESELPSGTLTAPAPGASGPVTGIQRLTYDATDQGSGVRTVELVVDGHPVSKNDYLPQCPYQSYAACPTTVSDTISWDTASVTDGQHSLELVVRDAAQNSRVIYADTLATHNATANTVSSPQGTFGALPGPGTNGAALVHAGAASSSTNGIGASETAQLHTAGTHTVARPFTHSALRLTGRLLDGEGRPVAGATLDVLEQIAGSHQSQIITHALSGADGSFSARVPPGPSRRVTVAYRAFSGDANYTTSANTTETVGAGVTLTVSPRQASATGTIVLAGHVHGPIPAQGALLELLVHYRGRWEPFRNTRTDSRGRFRVLYQFQGAVGHFPFRADAFAGQTGFPYAHGQSTAVTVSTS